MAFLGGNPLPLDLDLKISIAGFSFVAISGLVLLKLLYKHRSKGKKAPGVFKTFLLFAYSCFIKPHGGDANATQQDSLESFYKNQAGIYDRTRKILLQGREDMLALLAAQLLARCETGKQEDIAKPTWVDVGGGTGWNIEAMGTFVDVSNFFSTVYLVDLSPSLCEIARRRFQRLGWNNVKVICEDARTFSLSNYKSETSDRDISAYLPASNYFCPRSMQQNHVADLITMSYSLSMIPDHYSVIESLTSILSPGGLIGVIDFYVQSKVEFGFRNYTGGFLGRHVNWFMRTFWRAWFDLDRVSLEASRRDCLEYKFGTVLTVNARNSTLFGIPYYIWIGCQKKLSYDVVKKADALGTNSSFPLQISARLRSKGSVVATQNISANLPLPSFFYQNQHWRVYYDDNLRKHTQFNNEYIYAFTWEDSQVDDQILNLNADDVVLAITSAGDNILSYSMKSPARIHSVDLNPTQNHLLELKMACYTSLPYEDFWLLFGEGRHPEFRTLLLNNLSPHLSSRAFQYWLNHVHVFSGQERSGLYDTGGSRHGIRIFRWISCLFGCRSAVQKFLVTKSLNEQRELWFYKIRPVLLSNIVCKLIVGQESFLWSALGVPKHQLAMIEKDHAESEAVTGPAPSDRKTRSHAIWRYMVNTLDPVAEQTHISMDNPYYHVCMAGQFSRECHPDYLSRKAHTKLSRPGALDRISIHTDEVDEVLRHMTPGSLTVAVIMDSMDWFDPHSAAATVQITNLNRTLKMGGRVLLRSSALCPWYIKIFEDHGFSSRCMGSRTGGMCIDRVNMYASCWLCTKTENLPLLTPEMESMDGSDIDSFFA